MKRECLRVTHTSAHLDGNSISSSLASLHKLKPSGSGGVVSRLNPLGERSPITFEFVAISEGKDEPVEFYYGADERLDVLEQRLRAIYPSSFDIERVEVDLLKKLIQPVEYEPTVFHEKMQNGQLYDSDSIDLSTLSADVVYSDGGMIRTRPGLDELIPCGVRWNGSVDRRKDWMTTLTGFTENITSDPSLPDTESNQSGRAPLVPLIDQLTKAPHPLVFQVVFQRKPDWTKQARRRSGALLAGKDTLLQQLLSVESPGPRQRSNGHARNGLGSVNQEAGRIAERIHGGPSRAAVARSLAARIKAGKDITEAVFATLDEQKRSPGVILSIEEVPEVRTNEVSVEGEIVELWEPSTHSIQQVGLIADETGKIKFTIWRKSRQTMVREGERVRFRGAKKNWYQGRCSIALTYDSQIRFPEREPWWET